MKSMTEAPQTGARRSGMKETPNGAGRSIAVDLTYLRTVLANVFFFGLPGAGQGGWVLIDAGIPGSAASIRSVARERFGEGRPLCIVLTHGHFDHVGALRQLAREWDVPVYAHPLELPFVTGRSAYPPPDPSVGGGAMAALSFLYPRGPIDLGSRVRPLPRDCSVPGMPGWRWIHTPGHTAGHISLYRDMDRLLIAGDAFVTTDQESLLSVLSQREVVQGPPAYFTSDWDAAEVSVRTLAALEPEIVATGHGIPLRGGGMRRALRRLAEDFPQLGVPSRGRYVGHPAISDEFGVVHTPPGRAVPAGITMLAVGGAVLFGATIGLRARARSRSRRESRGR